MEPFKKPISINDLGGLTHALQNWSSQGLQTFLESGIASDIRQALKDPWFDFNKGLIFSSGLSTKVQWVNNPPPTFAQFQKLLSQAPIEDRIAWGRFCALVEQLSYSITWWECIASTWEMRDEFREVLGLKALNPRIMNGDGLEIIFRRAGHCTPWKKPPTAYRYATKEEVFGIEIPNDGEFGILAFYNEDTWQWYNARKKRPCEFSQSERESAFHALLFMVPLVKIPA